MIDHLADLRMSEEDGKAPAVSRAEFDAHSIMSDDTTQINLPTDEQVERAAKMLEEHGKGSPSPLSEIAAYNHCLLLLNKDRILGYR
jgi:hypothetical protein